MRTLAAALVLAIGSLDAVATENGSTAFPSGGEDFLVAAMPPPGFYGIAYANHYRADRVAGDAGDLPLDFALRVNALALRLDWVKPASVLGADRWGTLLVLPLLDVDLKLAPAPGVRIAASKRGIGDMTLGNGLHWSFERYHAIVAVDVVFPVGAYNRSDTVNLGRNQWVVRLNQMGTWFPAERWEVSYRAHADLNFRNPDTGYRSGRTAYLNLAAGWKPTPATTLGISSYALKQLSDDRVEGHVAGTGNRLAVRGIGPAIKHFFPNGIFVAASYYAESGARNGPRGDNVWIYAGMRF